MDNNQRPKREWELVKDFEKEGVVVRLQKSGYYYSWHVGRRPPVAPGATQVAEDRIIPYFSIRVLGTQSLVERLKLECNYAKVVAELLDEMQAYVLETEEYRRANKLSYMEERDAKQASFGKPKSRHTGKTERTREKKRQRMTP